MKREKIAVVGPGAIGCLVAAFLSKLEGTSVWLLDKDTDRARAINEQGIRVEGISGSRQVKVAASAEAAEIGVCDLVIIAVKSYDTKAAVNSAQGLFGPLTRVLTLQNGIGNIEIIGEVAGAEKVIGGVTNMGATLLGTGRVKHAGKGETVIGRIDGKVPAELRGLRELLNKAGIETRISRDIRGILWSKLIINAAINPLTAVTKLPNGKLLEFEGCRRILRELTLEAVRVAKRKRIKLLYDDPLAKVEAVCEATAGNVSSMLQDVLRKKRTEIDFINGVIVRQAGELGIPASANSLMLDLVKTIESSYVERLA